MSERRPRLQHRLRRNRPASGRSVKVIARDDLQQDRVPNGQTRPIPQPPTPSWGERPQPDAKPTQNHQRASRIYVGSQPREDMVFTWHERPALTLPSRVRTDGKSRVPGPALPVAAYRLWSTLVQTAASDRDRQCSRLGSHRWRQQSRTATRRSVRVARQLQDACPSHSALERPQYEAARRGDGFEQDWAVRHETPLNTTKGILELPGFLRSASRSTARPQIEAGDSKRGKRTAELQSSSATDLCSEPSCRLVVGAREPEGLATRGQLAGDDRSDPSSADDRGGHDRDLPVRIVPVRSGTE
jgi:hypothetical protein